MAGGRTSQGVVFRLNKDGSAYEILRSFSGLGTEGRNPYGAVVEGKDRALYGTTLGGGPQSCGLVFRLSRDGSEYKTLLAFTQTGPEGRSPYSGLTRASDDTLYGTTCGGATENLGAVFCIKVLSKP